MLSENFLLTINTKLSDILSFYTILQGPDIPPMAVTSCHDRGLNLLSKEERAGTLNTPPIRLANIISTCNLASFYMLFAIAGFNGTFY